MLIFYFNNIDSLLSKLKQNMDETNKLCYSKAVSDLKGEGEIDKLFK